MMGLQAKQIGMKFIGDLKGGTRTEQPTEP